MSRPNALRGPTMFHQATVTNNGTMYATVNDQQDKLAHLHLLLSEVATNAILNAGGRADVVRCHPGTRERIISITEYWIDVGYREDRRIFWLSGPAGAGKSSIVQTIAENCVKRKMAMANFFFFRADGSRNHTRGFVATLLHQLIQCSPHLTYPINDIISRDRLVFRKPLRDQLTLLLDAPIRSLRQDLPPQPPIILLIDGLDECDSRTDLDSETMTEQTTLLNAIHELVTSHNSPFIALVASRIESHIQMAFNQIGRAVTSIDLNDDNEADRDIRHYVTDEFANIRRTHPLRACLDASWPNKSTIDSIVEKSSGQFIYAAVVMRFLANSPQSPAITMEMVQQLRPAQKRSPFSQIDAVYTFILSRSETWQYASGIIALCHFSLSSLIKVPLLSRFYSVDEVPSYFCDLTSIMHTHITEKGMSVTFYHASFNDFIYSRKRAGKFYIDLSHCASYFAPQIILAISDKDTMEIAMKVLFRVKQISEPLTYALTQLPSKPPEVSMEREYDELVPEKYGLLVWLVAPLYTLNAPELYRGIFLCMQRKGWIRASVSLKDTLSVSTRVSCFTQYTRTGISPSPHRYLTAHGITWDLRDAPATINRAGYTISNRTLLEPACIPAQSVIHIQVTNTIWALSWGVTAYASPDQGYVSLRNIFTAIHTTLRHNITPDEWAHLSSPENEARAVQAYRDRYRRFDDRRVYHAEKIAGMKRVDLLMGCYHWIGVDTLGTNDWVLGVA